MNNYINSASAEAQTTSQSRKPRNSSFYLNEEEISELQRNKRDLLAQMRRIREDEEKKSPEQRKAELIAREKELRQKNRDLLNSMEEEDKEDL